MKILVILVVVATIVFTIWRYRRRSRRIRKDGAPFVIPSGVTISPTPLLAEDEVALYNLLRMVVQEHYLVLAQMPLCSFIAVDAMGKERNQVLRQLALKRVDFALVHPGSCQVEQVVQIEPESPQLHQVESQQVIESVLEAAGIKLVKLQARHSYPLPELASRLEITSDE